MTKEIEFNKCTEKIKEKKEKQHILREHPMAEYSQ